MARLKPIQHDEQLTLVEHLDELRTRIITSLVTLATAFALCFWQNNLILDVMNRPLPGDRLPITFGVTEPFFTTVTLSLYAALVLALPVILYQAYAFVLPAFAPAHARVVRPMLMLVPILFLAGVVFSYLVVLPAAIKFLLNFNDSQFNIQIRARDYYSFVSTTLISMGVVFQVPVGILAVTRIGIVTPSQLAKNRRYAYLAIAVVAMALPGTDPVTMLIEMVPLLALFELSVLLARIVDRRAARAEASAAST